MIKPYQVGNLSLRSSVPRPEGWERYGDPGVNCPARTIARFEYSDTGAVAEFIDVISGVDEHQAGLD
jgi:hypothetical protein